MSILKLLFGNMIVTIGVMAIYAIAIGVATFIENDYGTSTAKEMVYNAWWFDVLHLWLLLSLVGCFILSKAWKRKKWASLFFHASLIVIIIGAGITRFYGFEGTMSIKENQASNYIITNDTYVMIEAMNENNQVESIFIPTNVNSKNKKEFHQSVNLFGKLLDLKSLDISSNEQNGLEEMRLNIEHNGENREVVLLGGNRDMLIPAHFEIGEYRFFLAWGNKRETLPFAIKLTDFVLDRYPGSNSPSSYSSFVEVIDKDKEEIMPFHIYMNNVLDYGGYRFFQSSYFPDESGTILSVNNDPGKWPTYIGYFMMILGAIWLLFDKNGRFRKLSNHMKNQKLASVMLASMLMIGALGNVAYAYPQMESNASNTANTEHKSKSQMEQKQSAQASTEEDAPPSKERIESLIKNLKANSGDFVAKFNEILVQDFGGRIKPLDTLSMEYIHKITKKDGFLGLSNSQLLLGMMIFPEEFQYVQMIRTNTEGLRAILNVDKAQKYISFKDVFFTDPVTKERTYILSNYLEDANRKKPSERSTLDKDIISVDERINIAYMVFTGEVLKIFPDNSVGEFKKEANNEWYHPLKALEVSVAQNNQKDWNILLSITKTFGDGVQSGIESNSWDNAYTSLEAIKLYQEAHGSALIVDENKIKSEILLNKTNIFNTLTLPYILLGVLLFIFVLAFVLKNRPINKWVFRISYIIGAFLLYIHTIALGLRWYVSGHAPWSNAYESMLYIAWASAVAGIVFFRKSTLALCASLFLAGISLFVAHLGFMDPQIGNLVPVLKSYWLNIHVSVITASYGFLALCFILGVITLLMYILQSPKRPNIPSVITSLYTINEMCMILGLFLLTIGNFLGGIWANESWGRYWGWDSKETWSLATIGVYAIVLHLRLVVKRNLPYVFSASSVVAFFSVLMTYFGVNYYLSGMHSYAAGDPLPIPKFLYFMVTGILILVVWARFKAKDNVEINQ